MHAMLVHMLMRNWPKLRGLLSRRVGARRVTHRVVTGPSDRGQAFIAEAERIQREYWSAENNLMRFVLDRGRGDFVRADALRLVQLTCLEIVSAERRRTKAESVDSTSFVRKMWDDAARFTSIAAHPDSPCHGRLAFVYYVPRPGADEVELHGALRNASCTHLGSLEVIRLDERQQPYELQFVDFADLQQVVFAGAALHRSAKLVFNNGRRPELVYVPPLYGFTWMSGSPRELDGSYTRFHRPEFALPDNADLAIGFGQQDFILEGEQRALLGISGLTRIVFRP